MDASGWPARPLSLTAARLPYNKVNSLPPLLAPANHACGFYDPEGLTEDEAVAVIHRALDRGITLLNTSDLYGPYTGETVLGGQGAGQPQAVGKLQLLGCSTRSAQLVLGCPASAVT